jgi:hypothetical protein
MTMLPIALKLASAFLPDLIGALTKSDKAEQVAAKVVDIANTVAGTNDPSAALYAIQCDPIKQAALRAQVDANMLELARIDASVALGQQAIEQTEIKEWTGIMQALAEADKSGASTRPKIALWMAALVWCTSAAMVLAVLVAAWAGRTDTIAALTGSWEFLAVTTAVPAALLRAYFGLRSEDKKIRAGVALGQAPAPSVGVLSGLMGGKR